MALLYSAAFCWQVGIYFVLAGVLGARLGLVAVATSGFGAVSDLFVLRLFLLHVDRRGLRRRRRQHVVGRQPPARVIAPDLVPRPAPSVPSTTSAIPRLIAALVAGLSLIGQPAPYSAGALGWIALLAIGPQLIGHSSLNYALKYLPTTFVAMATLGEPIGSTVLAFVVLHEQPSLATWIGGALILAGIAAASHASGAP